MGLPQRTRRNRTQKNIKLMRGKEVTFEQCVEIILKHEGSYVNDSNDPGLETKWGISKRAYPKLDIKELTVEHAKEIYRLDYWDRMHCDNIHPSIRLCVFDCAVNQGVTRSTIYLQKSLGVGADGVFGPITLTAAGSVDPEIFITKFCKYRLDAYISNPRWQHFGAGWIRRLFDIMSRSYVYNTAMVMQHLS